jgi:hypothetical protein
LDGSKKTEHDKWNEMYRIIFPDDDLVPSPCKHSPILAS